ncbi:MAG: hypothetical protein ACKN9T_11185 [Candidatus Methylumidiphilus sp.]
MIFSLAMDKQGAIVPPSAGGFQPRPAMWRNIPLSGCKAIILPAWQDVSANPEKIAVIQAGGRNPAFRYGKLAACQAFKEAAETGFSGWRRVLPILAQQPGGHPPSAAATVWHMPYTAPYDTCRAAFAASPPIVGKALAIGRICCLKNHALNCRLAFSVRCAHRMASLPMDKA